VDRLIAAARSNPNWSMEEEKQSVMALLEEARKKYAQIAH